MAHKMNQVNRRWLELAAAGAVIEVCPNQAHLIDTEPPPSDPDQVTNPVGGWGPYNGDIQVENPIKPVKSPMRPGFDVDRCDWRTTWLVVLPRMSVQIPSHPPEIPAPILLPISAFRARADVVESLESIHAEVTRIVFTSLARESVKT